MPWTVKDVDQHKEGLTDKQKETWVKVANSALKRCQDEGGEDCEASAIRQANSVVGQQKESGMEYKAYTMSTNNVLISVNAIDMDGEAVPVAELVAAYEAQRERGDGEGEDFKEAKTKTVDGQPRPAGDFLVVEDSEKPSTWHLPVKKNGKPDHRLMGAAKAALTSPGGYRGNKYQGPNKAGAISKLKTLYKSEGMAWDEETAEMDVGKLYRLLSEALEMLDGQQQETAESELAESASGHVIGLAEADMPADGGPRAPLLMDVSLIKPGWGNKKDRHYYPPEVLKRDARVFEGVKMYTTDHRPEEKSVRTEVAVVKTCPVAFTDDGAPIAQVAVHDGDFAEQARNRKKLGTLESLECSILALGRTKKGEVDGEEANIVEAITRGQSVDWVTKAGAGGHALNLAENDGGETMSEQDKKKDEKVEETSEKAQTEEVVLTEKEQAQEKEAPQKLAEAEVEKLVDETNLPGAFKAALKAVEYDDEEAAKAAIAEAAGAYKTATGSGKPFAQGGSSGASKTMTEADYDEAYADILRRHGLQVQEVNDAG